MIKTTNDDGRGTSLIRSHQIVNQCTRRKPKRRKRSLNKHVLKYPCTAVWVSFVDGRKANERQQSESQEDKSVPVSASSALLRRKRLRLRFFAQGRTNGEGLIGVQACAVRNYDASEHCFIRKWKFVAETIDGARKKHL